MRKVLILLTFCFLVTPLSAEWRRGGLYGADVRALIVDPKNPDKFYLGTSAGDLYVSSDAARTWSRPRNGTPFPGYVVDNLVLDRSGRLWAAAWGLWGGGVIAVSEDGGRTWTRRDKGLEDFSVRAIALDPNDPKFVLVGGLTGVYRSGDSGVNWKKISNQINVESLAIDPRDRKRIYVGTWRQGWRSDDGGKNWKHVAEGMVLDTDMFSITIDPQKPDNVWVATCGWVYNSQNGGDLWTRYREGFQNRRIHDVDIDPADRNIVYAGSVAGLYRSTDAGLNWNLISDDRMVINSVVLHPDRPGRIVLGVEGDGVYISDDAGATYVRRSEGLHNLRVATIAPDPSQRDTVYAAVVFGGSASGIYRSTDGGMSWSQFSRTPLPEVLSLAVGNDRNADTRFLAGTEKGFFYSKDGENWTQAEPSGFPVRVDKLLRFNSQRFFAASSEGVFTTRDGGKSWYRLGDAATKAADIAIATVGGKRGLVALTSKGLALYLGDRWYSVKNAPSTGRSIAVRTVGEDEVVYIAGTSGVKAGVIGDDFQWNAGEAPDAQHASVHGGNRGSSQVLFLTARAQNEILIGDGSEAGWSELDLPVRNTDITSVVPDPFVRDRYFVGTFGEGFLVHQGKARRAADRPVTRSADANASSTAAGAQ